MGQGLLQVWFRSDAGLVQVLFRFCCCSSEWVKVWFRFGSGLMQVWFRSVSGLVQVWFRSGSGLVQIWFQVQIAFQVQCHGAKAENIAPRERAPLDEQGDATGAC